ncbi:hypothetical protein GOODEAATRI_005365 [Goodea atripinnis]|uniref:Uncharacterized protein n=1 Tax=Goodea atripinnis TaxID=208336 RepID=A0ABV0PL37_9TELE
METNTSVLSRTLPSNKLVGREEFNCSCFLYAGTFRFLLRQTSITAVSHANGTDVGLSTNEHFQTCSSVTDPALFLEVSYMEHNQVGRNTIDKVRAQTRKPIKPLRSQSVELPCAFPFTERDFIRVALQSPHTVQEVKSSGPLYLSRIFSYKLLVDNVNAYKSGCMGTMTVKMITPPCTHVNGKILLYNAGLGRGVDSTSPVMGFGPEEPSSSPMAFNWLTEEENETEFNCSVFYPGRHKYCFHFVFNFSRSSSPAHTCLVVYRSTESWGPWQPWSVCSVSCGEGVRERVRECLLPSGVQGMQCTGMMKEQSLCSLEDCNKGSSSTKGKWERQPHPSYPIPEHRVSDWSTTRAQSNDQRKAWVETAASSRNNQVKHTGTNTNNFSISEKNAKDFSGTGERKRLADPGGRVAQLVSGIGGPSLTRPWSQEVNQLGVGRAEWAEQNWNRRGPSPIQRNILARKLKEAQSCSGAKGRQRSSSFNVSSSNQRKDWCHSLPMSRDQNLSGGSPYRLSEAEKRMLDLDLSTVFVHEKE